METTMRFLTVEKKVLKLAGAFSFNFRELFLSALRIQFLFCKVEHAPILLTKSEGQRQKERGQGGKTGIQECGGRSGRNFVKAARSVRQWIEQKKNTTQRKEGRKERGRRGKVMEDEDHSLPQKNFLIPATVQPEAVSATCKR